MIVENETNLEVANPNIDKAKKCSGCQKVFDQTYWNMIKNVFNRDSPIECINCEGVFCSSCYKNEIRYIRKNPVKKGYSCNSNICLDETRVDSDIMFVPINMLKDSLEDVKNQLVEFKKVAEPILNNKIVPLLNDTKELVLSTQKTVEEAKNYLPVLNDKLVTLFNDVNKLVITTQETVNETKSYFLDLKEKYKDKDLKEQLKKLNQKFNWILSILTTLIFLLVIGEILICIKLFLK